MTANGGQGGTIAVSQNSSTRAGGTASGGNIANHTGGSSIAIGSGVYRGSVGGGALGFFGTGEGATTGTSSTSDDSSGAGMPLPPTDLIPQMPTDIKGGSLGTQTYENNQYRREAEDGDFGCGGGAGYLSIYNTSNQNYVFAGDGGIGGGGGGAYAYNGRNGNSASGYYGKGGSGMVLLEFV
jgi:hypothetical protein